MSTHEKFNLDRHISIENMIDPQGRKWEVHANRETALVHARPNPDRSDAQIPKEFSGQWTSAMVLKEIILVWLNRQWDKSDAAAVKTERVEQAEKEAVQKMTPEESLEALPDEIKDVLGDVIAVEKVDLATMKWDELQALAKDLGIKGRSRADLTKGIEEARA